jgi:acetyl coenzyme A synthetase (ADP forming)-like protein
MRFFSAVGERFLDDESKQLVASSPGDQVSLIVSSDGGDTVVGHAAYWAKNEELAEVAFLVADEWQGRGLGTLLVGEIAAVAAGDGFRRLQAIVRPGNHRMIQVFRDSGFDPRMRPEPGQIVVEFPADATPDARRRYEEREWSAAVAAVDGFLRPESVALVGASRRRGTIGGDLFHNLLSYGFRGPVFPVNATASSVQGVLAYPSVSAIPAPVDLAVIAVPATAVLDVVEECGAKGVRRLVVISAGFAETGEAGAARQEELLRLSRSAGMRVIGPNCMGIACTDDEVRLSATFAPTPPRPGRVAFMSQSGALGLAIMDYSSQLGIGLHSFVSVGNKADISGNDLLRFWADEGDVDVILLYLESFGNPRKFARIARRVGREKPIVAVKSGRSPAGARATGSHTGAPLAASDTTVDALFRQCGVIRTDTLEEMFDVAALLAHQPAPRGPRVAIVSNAGGPGILCADACVAEGLLVPRLSDETRAALGSILPPEASIENPVDMIASASPENFRAVVEVLGHDPDIDAVIVIFVPPLSTGADAVADAIVHAARTLRDRTTTLLTVFMQSRGMPERLAAPDLRIPSFAFPESAAIALARTARYGTWLTREEQDPWLPDDARTEEAAALIAAAMARGDEWLGPKDVAAILDCYGLTTVEQRWCDDPAAVSRAAAAMGGAVALKAMGADLVHKTEMGAVALGIPAGEAGDAATAMAAHLCQGDLAYDGFLVQRMAPEGLEMIVGAVHDGQFGPVLACGAGGTMVELLGDVAVRIAPISRDEAAEMLRELRIFPVLEGYRGRAPRDAEALVDVILRLGALVDAFPHILELDLNPVLVHDRGISLVDARVRVGTPQRAGSRSGGPATQGWPRPEPE